MREMKNQGDQCKLKSKVMSERKTLLYKSQVIFIRFLKLESFIPT